LPACVRLDRDTLFHKAAERYQGRLKRPDHGTDDDELDGQLVRDLGKQVLPQVTTLPPAELSQRWVMDAVVLCCELAGESMILPLPGENRRGAPIAAGSEREGVGELICFIVQCLSMAYENKCRRHCGFCAS